PNPFASLNHFTVPCSIKHVFLRTECTVECNVEELRAGTSQNRQKDQTEFDDLLQASTCRQGVPRLGKDPLRSRVEAP
ncbi:MAG TPA: hypothetical protein VGG80_10380, partial [Acidobacteriaceae bacterium]